MRMQSPGFSLVGCSDGFVKSRHLHGLLHTRMVQMQSVSKRCYLTG
jgi:hypothetical protein